MGNRPKVERYALLSRGATISQTAARFVGALGGLLFCGAGAAAVLAFWLARRLTGSIRVPEGGTARIGFGHFDRRFHIAIGDEPSSWPRISTVWPASFPYRRSAPNESPA